MDTGMHITFNPDNDRFHPGDSPHLLEVASKIKDLRDTVGSGRSYDREELREIQTDPHLNEQGKTERTAAVETRRKNRAHESLNTENEIIDNKIAEIERRLDGFIGYGDSNIIAYRDAQDRAEAVDSSTRATTLMTRALRSNDRTLAHALFRVAVEKQYTEAKDVFAKQNPEVAALVRDADQLRTLRNGFGRLLNYM